MVQAREMRKIGENEEKKKDGGEEGRKKRRGVGLKVDRRPKVLGQGLYEPTGGRARRPDRAVRGPSKTRPSALRQEPPPSP